VIRALIDTWMTASRSVDTQTVLSLMGARQPDGRWVIARDANLVT